jgi:hypothetical protein
MSNATTQFLGDSSNFVSTQITYDDTHPLWGGQLIAIRGDGHVVLTQTALGQEPTEHQLPYTAEKASEIFNTCCMVDLLSMPSADRHPVPDEVCIQISLTNARGETQSVQRWQQDPPNAAFDAVRRYFEALRPAVSAVTPVETPPVEFSPDRLLEVLRSFFLTDDWKFELNPSKPVLRLPFQGKNGHQWNCYAQVRTTQYSEQILFYSVASFKVPENKRMAIADFCTRANYGMAIGNFELDFSDGEVRYKTSIDATHAPLPFELIKPIVYHNVRMMDKYLPGVLKVIYSDNTPAAVIKEIEG